MTAITNRVLFSLWVPWKCGRWERGMFIAHHIMCHLKYSCNTQQGVLVLIWSSQCRGWNGVHVYGRRWCVTAFWMPCIHYKSPFDAVLLHLTFLVWFTLLFFGCVSEEFVFSKWDLKGQRECNTGTLSLSLLGEIIVCVVVSKLWIPILCRRFPRIVLQHCGLWSLRRTISEMKLPQDAGGLLFHLVLGSHSNTSSPSTSATWRMRACLAFALVNLLLLEQTTGEEWTRSARSNRPVEPAAVLSVGAQRETLRLGSASLACLGFLLSKVGDGAWYFFTSLWLRFKANLSDTKLWTENTSDHSNRFITRTSCTPGTVMFPHISGLIDCISQGRGQTMKCRHSSGWFVNEGSQKERKSTIVPVWLYHVEDDDHLKIHHRHCAATAAVQKNIKTCCKKYKYFRYLL